MREGWNGLPAESAGFPGTICQSEFLCPTEPTPRPGSVGATCALSSAAGCHGAHAASIAEASWPTAGSECESSSSARLCQVGFSPLLSACPRASWIQLVNCYQKKKKASGFIWGSLNLTEGCGRGDVLVTPRLLVPDRRSSLSLCQLRSGPLASNFCYTQFTPEVGTSVKFLSIYFMFCDIYFLKFIYLF